MSQFEASSANMSWDWQQFTPSCTPTTTVFDIDAQNNHHSLDHNVQRNIDLNALKNPNNDTHNGLDHAHAHTHNHHSNAATPTQTHFHEAFPNYAYAHHKRDSVASTATATSIDSNPHYVAYPHVHQHQQSSQPQSYSSYDYAATPLFVQGPPQPQGFQMQTPPPTRGSSVKSRPQRLDTNYPTTALSQPDFDASAFSFNAPQHAMNSWTQPSGPLSAPLSAPAWTANQDDPFSHWSAHTPQSSQSTVVSQSSHSQLPPQPSTSSRPAITRSTSSNNVPYATPTAVKKPSVPSSVPSSVNPTHLYSSPVRSHFPDIPEARPVSPEKPSLAPAFPSTSGNISPVEGSVLRRSNTVGNFLRPSPVIVSQASDAGFALGRSNSVTNLPRRSSPLKRVARGSLSSIAETSRPQVRTSVVLTIDANGTARTETRVIEESPSQSNKDSQSIKEKYPNLWDDSDSDSDSTCGNRWPSRHDSLAHTNAGQERSAKMARLDTSSENLEMAQLPRSNSTVSLKTPCKAAYTAAMQLRRQGSAKKQQRPSSVQSRRNTLSSLNSSFENLAAMDLNKDEIHAKTDAGSALRQAAAQRASPSARQIQHLSDRNPTDHTAVQSVRVKCSDTLPPGASRPRQLSQPQHLHQSQQVQQTHQVQQTQAPQVLQQQMQQPQPQNQRPVQQVQQTQQLPPSNQIYPHTHAKSHSVSYPTATSTAPVFDPRGSFTMDFTPVAFTSAPPPQTFTNDMSSMTRCICQIPFDDGRMVRCNLCAMYSHSGCVGLDPTQHAYVCSFCASANPMSYGHPVRSSSIQNFNAWSVPGL